MDILVGQPSDWPGHLTASSGDESTADPGLRLTVITGGETGRRVLILANADDLPRRSAFPLLGISDAAGDDDVDGLAPIYRAALSQLVVQVFSRGPVVRISILPNNATHVRD